MNKIETLKRLLQKQGRIAVAFSGGLDSSVLLAYAVSVAGVGNCLAVTAHTPYMMDSELGEAAEFCRQLGVRQIRLDIPVLPEVSNNPPDRCYVCKKYLFTLLKETVTREGYSCLADGTNKDDDSDYRPGMKALDELGIASPLRDAGMGKEDIRNLALLLGLAADVVDKPAYACLLTRLEHNKPFGIEDLRRVDEAEGFLRSRGVGGCRVRVHDGGLARIEVPESAWSLFASPGVREEIVQKLKKLGYSFVTLDLKGYTRGSMNQRILE